MGMISLEKYALVQVFFDGTTTRNVRWRRTSQSLGVDVRQFDVHDVIDVVDANAVELSVFVA